MPIGIYKHKPLSENTKKKISIKLKGNKNSLGHTVSQEARTRMSNGHKGEKNYLWKSDRTKLVKSEKKHLDGRYRDWMIEVKKRDKWRCKINNTDCNGTLEAHHILPWRDHPELRYDVNNGITLCKYHHPLKRVEELRLVPLFRRLIFQN